MNIQRPLLASVAAVAAAAVSSAQELNLYAWSEYIPQSVIDDFTAETGIKVNYETYASNEEMFSKLLAGATVYDLIQPSEYAVESLIRAGRLAKIDFANIPNFKHLDPDYLHLPHDPNQEYSVPYMAGTVGIVVNTEKVTDPVTGYADLFSGKYRGRIVVLDDARELVAAALATLGLGINNINRETLRRVRPVLAEWLPQVKLFDSDSPKTALLNGEVDLGLVWSGEAAILYNEDEKFQYVLPVEGAHMFIDHLAIPRNARNQAAAEKFIDYILRPEVSVRISEEFPYTNPNLAARRLLTPEQLANPASYPAAGKLETFRDIGRVATQVDRLLTEVKARRR
jgi:spermidine/putrescine-binding protein